MPAPPQPAIRYPGKTQSQFTPLGTHASSVLSCAKTRPFAVQHAGSVRTQGRLFTNPGITQLVNRGDATLKFDQQTASVLNHD